jgi:hypothetical protein
MSLGTKGATLNDCDSVSLEVLWIPVIELGVILERRVVFLWYAVPQVLKGSNSPPYCLFSVVGLQYQSDHTVPVLRCWLLICHQEEICASRVSGLVVDVTGIEPLILYVREIARMSGKHSGKPH